MGKPIVELTPDVRKAQRQLASDVMMMKDRLFRAGLVLTAQEMEAVTKKIGWEIAAMEDGTWPNLAND